MFDPPSRRVDPLVHVARALQRSCEDEPTEDSGNHGGSSRARVVVAMVSRRCSTTCAPVSSTAPLDTLAFDALPLLCLAPCCLAPWCYVALTRPL
jgi:hypothetical protein